MLASKMNIATARLTAATCRRALPISGKARKPITPDKRKLRLKYIRPLPCAAAQFQHPVALSRIRRKRGDRKPRRVTGISLCAVSWKVELQVNIFLEKPFVFDKRVFVE